MISELDAARAVRFAATLLQLAIDYNFSVTSWGRTLAHNKAVGGAATSKHLKFLGADVLLEPNSKEDRGYFTARAKALGLVVVDEGDHLHVQPPKGVQW